jgi:Polyketide cyclase / dehydrase and lipid transport
MEMKDYFKTCEPTAEYSSCIKISVPIHAPAEKLFDTITDISRLSDFFPNLQFESDLEGGILREVGDEYKSKQNGSKTWAIYQVVAIEKNRRLSAQLISSDSIFAAIKYDHWFIESGEETISEETIEYTPRYGLLGKVLDFIIIGRMAKGLLSTANTRLKAYGESAD